MPTEWPPTNPCPKRDWLVHCPCWTKGRGPCCACGEAATADPTPQTDSVATVEAAEAEVRALRDVLASVRAYVDNDIIDLIDQWESEAIRATTADPTPKCFCPGGGEPEGLNHRPGCPLASETKT